jgi:hypothetical protein
MGDRSWQRPLLTALARNKPEENVLDSCKAVSANPGPDFNVHGCGKTGSSCAACQPRGGGS